MNPSNNIIQANKDERLMKYLNGELEGEVLHEFEKEMAESSLLNDAVEGLQILENNTKIDAYVNDLNKHLHNYTSSKKKRRLKNKFELNDWTLLSIFLIITLCVVAYVIIKKMH